MVNGTVYFDGTGSSDDIGITSWTWTFSYGEALVTLTGPAPNHTFLIAGTFVVGLRVQDAAGNAATDTMTVTVRSPGGDDGGRDDPDVPGPEAGYKVWRSLILVVIVVVAFAVAITVNSLQDRRWESLMDQSVFFRRRSHR